jgi:Fe-S-cluster containining protein
MLKIYSESSQASENQEDDLSEIVELAESDTPPPEPEGGIPKQWVPGWIRWPIRGFVLPFVLLDLAAQWVAKILIPPPYKKAGKCLKRGTCCHYILVPEAKGLWGRIYFFWNTQILGFYQRSPEVYESEGKHVYVMGCRYLTKGGACGHYHLRPAVCRKWPVIEYFGKPRIIKGCGFIAMPRKK